MINGEIDMKKLLQRSLSLVLAFVVVFTGLAVTANKAAAKAKSYKTYIMFADSTWKVQNGMSDDACKGAKNIKNKKGAQKVTLNINRSDLDGKDEEITAANVLCVDVVDLMKDYKESKVKISNVVVKVDGKKVAIKAAKLKQGYIEKEHQSEGNYKYRLELFNEYGDTQADPCAAPEKFAFKKSLSISFKIKLK